MLKMPINICTEALCKLVSSLSFKDHPFFACQPLLLPHPSSITPSLLSAPSSHSTILSNHIRNFAANCFPLGSSFCPALISILPYLPPVPPPSFHPLLSTLQSGVLIVNKYTRISQLEELLKIDFDTARERETFARNFRKLLKQLLQLFSQWKCT